MRPSTETPNVSGKGSSNRAGHATNLIELLAQLINLRSQSYRNLGVLSGILPSFGRHASHHQRVGVLSDESLDMLSSQDDKFGIDISQVACLDPHGWDLTLNCSKSLRRNLAVSVRSEASEPVPRVHENGPKRGHCCEWHPASQSCCRIHPPLQKGYRPLSSLRVVLDHLFLELDKPLIN